MSAPNKRSHDQMRADNRDDDDSDGQERPPPQRRRTASTPPPVGSGRRWTDEEERYLLSKRKSSMPYKSIAKEIGKTTLACRLHHHHIQNRNPNRRTTINGPTGHGLPRPGPPPLPRPINSAPPQATRYPSAPTLSSPTPARGRHQIWDDGEDIYESVKTFAQNHYRHIVPGFREADRSSKMDRQGAGQNGSAASGVAQHGLPTSNPRPVVHQRPGHRPAAFPGNTTFAFPALPRYPATIPATTPEAISPGTEWRGRPPPRNWPNANDYFGASAVRDRPVSQEEQQRAIMQIVTEETNTYWPRIADRLQISIAEAQRLFNQATDNGRMLPPPNATRPLEPPTIPPFGQLEAAARARHLSGQAIRPAEPRTILPSVEQMTAENQAEAAAAARMRPAVRTGRIQTTQPPTPSISPTEATGPQNNSGHSANRQDSIQVEGNDVETKQREGKKKVSVANILNE